MICGCPKDDALDCAKSRYGGTVEPCECSCHEADEDQDEVRKRAVVLMGLPGTDPANEYCVLCDARIYTGEVCDQCAERHEKVDGVWAEPLSDRYPKW